MADSSGSLASSQSVTVSTPTTGKEKSPLFLLSNICNLISEKLDSTNFVLWNYQITSLLEAHKLYGYVNGDFVAPPRFLPSSSSETPQINPKFVDWHTEDQGLKTLLNATLSSTALSYVVGSKTSREVWQNIEKRFSSLSRTHILSLKSDLQEIKKLSSESIDAYVQRIKDVCDQLVNVAVHIDDDDLILHTLNGLPAEFNTFKTSLRTRSEPVSLEDLYVLLKTEERELKKQSSQSDILNLPAVMMANLANQGRGFVTNQGNGRNNNNRGRNFNSGKGKGQLNNKGKGILPTPHVFQNQNTQGQSGGFTPNQNGSSSTGQSGRIWCQICSKSGHSGLDCYKRMDYSYQGRHPPAQLAAMAADANQRLMSTFSANNAIWLTDSGANAHLTSELANLNFASNYNGEEHISVGNGQELPVSHTGSGPFLGSNSSSRPMC